eukprot:5676909-Heterocapsa_arctica.AAC.1
MQTQGMSVNFLPGQPYASSPHSVKQKYLDISSGIIMRWKHSLTSATPRLAVALHKSRCPSSEPREIPSGSPNSIRAMASAEHRETPGELENRLFALRASRISL